MSTSSTAPILPASLAAPALPVGHDSGADNAPGVIVVDSCTTLGTTLIVRLVGEIDCYSVAPLRALLASAAADGYTGLVLDTARVAFCDSSLLAVLDWWPRRGRRLTLASRSRAVRRLLIAAAADGSGQPAAQADPLMAAATS
ncbi:STAS domain-containing protein [Streptomyces sp. NPDC006553]|uniref:STAS domain-containing protein n=1 Tax=unclassified Streptomyces TaxID=2593676 RepID=UPI00224CA98E|nr:STAS domain-containing protein [Streptomyces sp. NBC_00233]MCX5232443.1 STAS domain-containing protein [Streptomyces sp. NBC_00233]